MVNWQQTRTRTDEKSVEKSVEKAAQTEFDAVTWHHPELRNMRDLKSYIILPGKTHNSSSGSYSYPDLLVSMNRLSYDSRINKVARILRLYLQNTAQEENGAKYFTLLHKNALKLTLMFDHFPLNPIQGVDFVNLLESGKAYNGWEEKIDEEKLYCIKDEMVGIRDPPRREWWDAIFERKNGGFYMNYDHRIVNGQLKPRGSEPLEDCFTNYKNPGITLEDWLKNPNYQGLGIPKDYGDRRVDDFNSKKKELYSWRPKDKFALCVNADKKRASINCAKTSRFIITHAGVRAACVR